MSGAKGYVNSLHEYKLKEFVKLQEFVKRWPDINEYFEWYRPQQDALKLKAKQWNDELLAYKRHTKII